MVKAPGPSEKPPKAPARQKTPCSKASKSEVKPLGEQLDPPLNESLSGVFNVTQAARAACKTFSVEYSDLSASIAAALGPARVLLGNIDKLFQSDFFGVAQIIATRNQTFLNSIAPHLEEIRVQKRILDLGFVPHAVLFKHLGNVEEPVDLTSDEFSQGLAVDVWTKVRESLRLSIEDCLGDQRIFHTFDEMIAAHEAGLYQLTAPSAFFVIERAARLAQPGEGRKKTFDWLKDGLGDMTIDDVPAQWRRGWTEVWAVLYKQAFCDVRTDDHADTLPFPHRHALAHGIGGKINAARESINCVLLAHFVISAAAAFQSLVRDEPVGSP
ncbi:hypothetical protein RZS28_02935 [Methylocapsa polymorpha]|uniref:Uncharacterized protein n=1 Tax=Methylocapsa polymorpha TaxID=3080828 RepID=A0ABZ0HU90_9HYPH|nr:hypothetical protein RZS28_02935 [Methylocapsa sp. RX1]